jgi:hypothetical protein
MAALTAGVDMMAPSVGTKMVATPLAARMLQMIGIASAL